MHLPTCTGGLTLLTPLIHFMFASPHPGSLPPNVLTFAFARVVLSGWLNCGLPRGREEDLVRDVRGISEDDVPGREKSRGAMKRHMECVLGVGVILLFLFPPSSIQKLFRHHPLDSPFVLDGNNGIPAPSSLPGIFSQNNPWAPVEP